MKNDTISLAHGSGGEATGRLVEEIFQREFKNPWLDQMEDAAVVPGAGRLALTTDSFVVTPLIFPGGDIGRLSVCGTVNDLLMSGARPAYLTCGFILEEGFSIEVLRSITESMAKTMEEAGVSIVAGDTKVVDRRGESAGLIINTAGVGILPDGGVLPEAARCIPGDAILVSGALGDHHAAILSARMGISNEIVSDAAPLREMVERLMDAGIDIHAMRDVTRGGLATILREFSAASGCGMHIEQEALPVHGTVRDLCGLLGLDPLYMGNEGKMVLVVADSDAEQALQIIRSSRYGKEAERIGMVTDRNGSTGPDVTLRTPIGGMRRVGPLIGEGLPRIC